MDARWQNVVLLANEVERAYSKEQAPDVAYVARLARAVLNLQQHMVGERPAGPLIKRDKLGAAP